MSIRNTVGCCRFQKSYGFLNQAAITILAVALRALLLSSARLRPPRTDGLGVSPAVVAFSEFSRIKERLKRSGFSKTHGRVNGDRARMLKLDCAIRVCPLWPLPKMQFLADREKWFVCPP